MGSRVPALLLLVGLIGLPALAQASPPDPTWIGGLFDAADFDDVVLAATSGDGAADGASAGTVETPTPSLRAMPPAGPTGLARVALRASRGRAPPLA